MIFQNAECIQVFKNGKVFSENLKCSLQMWCLYIINPKCCKTVCLEMFCAVYLCCLQLLHFNAL